MYVIVQHQIKDKGAAMMRGERLIKNTGAPSGAKGLQFYPSRDSSAVTCLWEADSVQSIQDYVDSTMGDASVNICYEMDDGHAFADRPASLAMPPRRDNPA